MIIAIIMFIIISAIIIIIIIMITSYSPPAKVSAEAMSCSVVICGSPSLQHDIMYLDATLCQYTNDTSMRV